MPHPHQIGAGTFTGLHQIADCLEVPFGRALVGISAAVAATLHGFATAAGNPTDVDRYALI